MNWIIIMETLFLALGVGITIIGIIKQLIYNKKVKTGNYKQIIGRIIDFDISSHYDSEYRSTTTMYYPIIEYEVDNKKYKYTSKIGKNIKKDIGQSEKLMYDVKSPSKAIDPNYKQGTLIAIVGAIITIVTLIIVLAIYKMTNIKYLI